MFAEETFDVLFNVILDHAPDIHSCLTTGTRRGKKKKKKDLAGNAFPLKHGTSLPGDCLVLAVIEELPLALCMCIRVCARCMCIYMCV